VADAALKAGRHDSDVRLVAISKGHPASAIEEAYRAGQRVFGESRAQELAGKVSALPADLEWHFVGPLQRNKVRQVRPAVRLLHSLDRIELAEAWMKGPGAAPPALLQVRLGGESTKHGFDPDAVPEALERCARLGVMVVGLMSIPPPARPGGDVSRWFSQLRSMRDVHGGSYPSLTELSMGMSDDFESAIAHGATIIRVGSAIFGPRTY